MAERSLLPYLLISPSTDAESTWPPVYLSESPTCLGRPEEDAAGPAYIDLRFDAVSRQHARFWREQGGYVLENWHGRYGIGLFEREL